MNHITKPIQPSIMNAKETDVFSPSTFPTTPFGQGLRQTFSLWLYVNDLNYKYGNKKYILTRKTPGKDTPNMNIYISQRSADIMLEIATTSEPDSLTTVKIGTLPLKKWHSLVIVHDRNVVDIFVNGRIAFTSGGMNPIFASLGDQIVLSERNGWSGYRAKFRYSNFNENMQGVRSIVDEGPLEMGYMNPLFYVYMVLQYINSANNYILGLALPNPENAALDALQNLEDIPTIEICPSEQDDESE